LTAGWRARHDAGMSDDERCEWSPTALVALIRRHEEQLAVVTAQLAAAQARIGELEAELARRGGPPKTPEHSSTPPSKGWKRERPPTGAEGAKRGRPVGHPGTSRQRGEPVGAVEAGAAGGGDSSAGC